MNPLIHPIHSLIPPLIHPTYSIFYSLIHPRIHPIHLFTPPHHTPTAPPNAISPLTAIQFSLFQFAIPLRFLKAI